MTGALNIALYNSSKDVNGYIEYVRGSEDPDILGSTSLMAEEIVLARLSKKGYMGGTSTRMSDCEEDAKVLLARVLADSFPLSEVADGVKERLEIMTSDIRERTGIEDQATIRRMVERRFVGAGLKYLEVIVVNSY